MVEFFPYSVAKEIMVDMAIIMRKQFSLIFHEKINLCEPQRKQIKVKEAT